VTLTAFWHVPIPVLFWKHPSNNTVPANIELIDLLVVETQSRRSIHQNW